MREGELVREVEDQSIVNYEREIGELVREVEDQSATTYEREVGQSDRRYLCWICGDRPFNARHQLVDHIEGAGGGGKAHLKMRKRWIEAGQPMREDWLEILEDAKREGNINVTNSRQQIFDSNKAKGLLGRRNRYLLYLTPSLPPRVAKAQPPCAPPRMTSSTSLEID